MKKKTVKQIVYFGVFVIMIVNLTSLFKSHTEIISFVISAGLMAFLILEGDGISLRDGAEEIDKEAK